MNMEINKFQEIESKFQEGINADAMRTYLVQLGVNDDLLDEHMSYFKKLVYKKQQKLGFKLLQIGALLCLASCLLTFIHDYSAGYTIITLYGITVIGTCLLLAGLALVFGL